MKHLSRGTETLIKHLQDSVTLKSELHVLEAYMPQYMCGNLLGSCKMSPVIHKLHGDGSS